jgi:N-acetylneuraminic acid mutarotase/ribosomal protein S11
MKPSLKLSFLRLAILVVIPCLLVGCGTSYTAPATYTIGGTVSGLSGTGLVLQDNGGNNLPVAASGTFTFTTAVASGGAYAVTVFAQPSNPAQNCVVTNGSGTASAKVTTVQVTCVNVFTIGGMVSGLSGSGLVLQDNGGNNLSVAANGSFTFTAAVNSGGAYAVTVFTQPSNPLQNCAVTNGSGNAGANVTNVQVTCTIAFTIGGTVTNLAGTGLVLQDNGGNNLSVTTNGSFTFTAPVDTGTAYAVTVFSQPSSPAQTCSVANGSGTANANVTNIAVNCGHNEWAWMSGSNVPNNGGTYGTLGVPDAANVPGVRNFGPVSWTDTSGNLWLFGGNGIDSAGTTGDLNDLWKYNIVSGHWTWVSGSNLINQNPSYGALNVPATTNVPGARDSAVSWIDASGNLWLFGGVGNDSTGAIGYLNDLWEYTVSTNEWTWMGGSNMANQNGSYGTLGVPAAGNIPGARGFSTVQNISGEVWLFGGFGNDSAGVQDNLNDLWDYTLSTGKWTWMGGLNFVDEVGVYGAKGTVGPLNIPGARYSPATWTDTSGNFWLFGGSNLEVNGTTVDSFNDLWEFSTVSKEWTWMNGSNLLNQIGTYGTLGTAALGNTPGSRSDLFSWTDPSGNFWLFGGFGNDSTTTQGELNDLWEYSVATNEWTWKKGPNVVNQNGTFGTLGQLAPGNIPESREGGASWADASGNLWLFAGSGANAFNDLWMYFP